MSSKLASVDAFLKGSNHSIVGISPDEPDMIYGGYDEITWQRDSEWYSEWCEASPAVRVALADYMIALWQQRRAQWANEASPVMIPEPPKPMT